MDHASVALAELSKRCPVAVLRRSRPRYFLGDFGRETAPSQARVPGLPRAGHFCRRTWPFAQNPHKIIDVDWERSVNNSRLSVIRKLRGRWSIDKARLEHMFEFREAPVDNERVSPHKHRITDYLRPKTLAMLLLGFSSGLPFLLVGNTFGYWLRDEHTSLTAIGFLSWVGIAYSLKFLWAPLMDRVDLPLFKRLGHRRGWMMFSQIVIGLALSAMGGTGTKAGLGRLGAFALVVAFASSTLSASRG